MRRDDFQLPSPPRMVRPGESFVCGRSPSCEPCSQGPNASGQCPFAHSQDPQQLGCHPKRTWTGKRRRLTTAGLIGLAIAMLVLFFTRITPKVIQPGHLTTAHAQILAGELSQDRCAACHQNVISNGWLRNGATSAEPSETRQQAGLFGLASWFTSSDADHANLPTVEMTDLCLNCHEQQMPRESARWAHNLSPTDREALTLAAMLKQAHQATPLSDAQTAELLATNVSRTSSLQNNLACSICHQEHHGADANLAAITDSRCQSCHVNQFRSFADSHPEFGEWPYAKQPNIHFDHARHAKIHFPSEAEKRNPNATSHSSRFATFDCRSCHVGPNVSSTGLNGDSSDPITTTLPYEVACAACHDEALKVQVADGPSLLQLPTFPEDIAAEAGHWPENATGFADGGVDGWMALLLRSKANQTAVRRFQRVDSVDWDSSLVRLEAVSLAKSITGLSSELASDGQDALMQRLVDAGVDPRTAKPLVESFPPQLVRDAIAVWFGDSSTRPSMTTQTLSSETESGLGSFDDELTEWNEQDALLENDPLLSEDPLLSDDPLGFGEPLLEEPSFKDTSAPSSEPRLEPMTNNFAEMQTELSTRYDASKTQSFGGWYRDDLTMSIRYRGKGHSDAVLRSMIEIAQQLPVEDPLRDALLKQPAIAACADCHRVGKTFSGEADDAMASMRWRAFQAPTKSERLTRFSHAPHLNIQGLQDCSHCHQLNAPTAANMVHSEGSSVDAVSPEVDTMFHSEFLPMTKSSCASCHTRSAAGDHCTRCHNYHVHELR
ncbi:hypothetical protein LOC71_02060 [Rhodopirellula sp. JC740]|uniref:Doubled CXXCH motif (Paired_CXXCH_1) n=1 Tax=Rhodopirellula halodulae TaxID=2894198 RepID=A0ABS8NBW2_9BACT|nr:hypothetical protein [Rhodopirellula sp. JC740]MCC9641041.1 hypothetical protein [Rhodopirellula sp. JC740]